MPNFPCPVHNLSCPPFPIFVNLHATFNIIYRSVRVLRTSMQFVFLVHRCLVFFNDFIFRLFSFLIFFIVPVCLVFFNDFIFRLFSGVACALHPKRSVLAFFFRFHFFLIRGYLALLLFRRFRTGCSSLKDYTLYKCVLRIPNNIRPERKEIK